MTDLLYSYKTTVKFLGSVLGPDYEVVLQDLSNINHSVIAIENGHISGRTIGSPLTSAVFQMLSSKVYEEDVFIANYKGVAENGHILRSSSMFIKDSNGNPIGLLCINFDDSRYMELHEKLFSLIDPGNLVKNISSGIAESKENVKDLSSRITENFAIDVASLREQIFNDATASFTTPVDRLNQNERKEIMIKLYEQGLFQLKGSIPFVAKRFSCSQATIYRYLGEINN